tara:strand:+ start:994 stop:1317 length:324 start_codon:yes stop_codon:yes gene_type:complete
MESTPKYIRTVSRNGKIYWKPPPEVYTETSRRYYEGSKDKIIRQKLLKQVELNGRIPTKTSVDKYDITPAELMGRYEIFRTENEDEDRVKNVQEKLLRRISEKWLKN